MKGLQLPILQIKPQITENKLIPIYHLA